MRLVLWLLTLSEMIQEVLYILSFFEVVDFKVHVGEPIFTAALMVVLILEGKK